MLDWLARWKGGVVVRLEVRKVGNSLVIPSEALGALRVDEGDILILTEAPGGYRITAYDPEFEKPMMVAERVMKRYRNALRKLAQVRGGRKGR